MDIVQLVIGILLYFVLFFSIAFLLNMLLRSTWFMAFVYPVIIFLIVDDFSFGNYFTDPSWAFPRVFSMITDLKLFDILILSGGFAGTIAAGIVIRMLRKSGYQMF
ncbi:YuiB family protein [Thalassobacillus devorans]|uniref:YuiB family protein n=1 Tax=Thalassobacillus devorans TaxID=279813 RepID=UPI0020CAF60B|nr:YuiB family protein [Thalassobacillus devorans]